MDEKDLTDAELQELFVATLNGDRPSRSGVHLVAKAMNGPDFGRRIKALGVLAKAGNQDEKRAAWSGLRGILPEHSGNLKPEDTFNLVFVLMQCLDEEHLAEQQFRDYMYEVACDASAPVRCNGLIVLRRLAQDGDERALALVKHALSDPDDRVRLSATTFLAALER
jgi:hypothetical protein